MLKNNCKTQKIIEKGHKQRSKVDGNSGGKWRELVTH